MVPTGRPSVDIADLTKVYPRRGGVPVTSVDHLSLSVSAGRVFALLGANGAGKTTTIKMICGLVIPSSGTVRVEGDDVRRFRRRVMARMGVVLEGTRNLYWRLTPWENLLYFGRLRGWWGRRLRARAEGLLRDLGLWDRRHQTVQLLSRGMQQQVAIAAAVIADPSVVILDEPTLGLDAEAARRVRGWILALSHDHGKTVILTTHQLDMAQAVSDDVAIMSHGRLVASRPMADLLEMSRVGAYRIRVKGTISGAEHRRLEGWDLAEEDGDTVLVGHVTGDAQLYGVLDELRRQRAPLLEVAPAEADLEHVYLRLLGSDAIAAR
jgi:ABC-2 type transport system ATP-binding protein